MSDELTPLERGYKLTRENPKLLDELAKNLFHSHHFDPNTNPLGKAVRRLQTTQMAWWALPDAEREKWRQAVLRGFDEELAANAVGEQPTSVERDHDTDSLDCWCGPTFYVRCDEHERDEWNERCWKCNDNNGLLVIDRATADAEKEPVIIVHAPEFAQ